jgi:hypothetical protein
MSKNIIPLTAERLHELLHYDPETGVFTWRVRRRPHMCVGAVAGCAMDNYWCVRIDNRPYRAHRLAWFYVHGAWPLDLVDHIDGDGRNNRIKNLREATHATNAQSQRRARKDNKTGFLGVAYYKANNTYTAQIRLNGAKKHLGYFTTAAAAHNAYLDAKRRGHPACAI